MTYVRYYYNLVQVAEDAIRDLENRDALETRMRQLGRLHEEAGVRRQYLDAMGPLFCQAVRPVLQAQGLWGEDVREAWLRVFRIVAYHMKKG